MQETFSAPAARRFFGDVGVAKSIQHLGKPGNDSLPADVDVMLSYHHLAGMRAYVGRLVSQQANMDAHWHGQESGLLDHNF